jgi:hypothetical protein
MAIDELDRYDADRTAVVEEDAAEARSLRADERHEVAAEIAEAAALVRKSLIEDADYLEDDYRAASEALAVLLEKTSASFGRIPAGVAIATLKLARALSVLEEDEDGSKDDPPAERAPRISQPMFDTIRRAEQLADKHGDRALSNDLYGLGCTLGNMR